MTWTRYRPFSRTLIAPALVSQGDVPVSVFDDAAVQMEPQEILRSVQDGDAEFGRADRHIGFRQRSHGPHVDLLSEDSVLNPLWPALHQALHNPASLTDGSMQH